MFVYTIKHVVTSFGVCCLISERIERKKSHLVQISFQESFV